MAARRRRPPPSAPRRIAIGSQHPAKVAAATAVLRQAFPHAQIIALTVDSGVRPAPTSAEETIQGALGRARRALEEAGADLGIGIEDGIEETPHGTFLGGWAAVVDRSGRGGLGGGTSARSCGSAPPWRRSKSWAPSGGSPAGWSPARKPTATPSPRRWHLFCLGS